MIKGYLSVFLRFQTLFCRILCSVNWIHRCFFGNQRPSNFRASINLWARKFGKYLLSWCRCIKRKTRMSMSMLMTHEYQKLMSMSNLKKEYTGVVFRNCSFLYEVEIQWTTITKNLCQLYSCQKFESIWIFWKLLDITYICQILKNSTMKSRGSCS